MVIRNGLVSGLALAGVLACVMACGSDDDSPATTEGTGGSDNGGAGAGHDEGVVEIFSWWVNPGEAEALQALVDLHEDQNPGSTIFNAAAEDHDAARDRLAQRLEDGDPPDLFQDNAHELPEVLADRTDEFESLDALFEANSWADHFLPEVIADVTYQGDIYAMPVNMHRENTLYYNKAIFAQYDLDPPTTIEELLTVCATLDAEGVTPMATGFQGWIIRILFNGIAAGTMGPTKYQEYFSGNAEPDDPAIAEAVETLGIVLDQYINEDASDDGFGWTQAAEALYNGDAAMFIHGDWATAYFRQLGWEAGVDFGAQSTPGASDLFLYGVDVFVMPQGGPNPEGARLFLETIASPEGQVAFNKIKGSSPIRLDVPAGDLGAVGEATLQAMQDAEIRMLVPQWQGWDDEFLAFAQSGDSGALVEFFVDTYPGF